MAFPLIIENLSYWFEKNQPVISNFSVRLEPGEILLLGGRNGSGKTTLLKILATLILPRSGRLALGPHDYSQSPAELRSITSYGPGSPSSFYDNLSGLRNLEFFYQLKKPDQRFPLERAMELADRIALDLRCGLLFRHYSTGMRQKLGILRALLTDPSLLLLDEPGASLDSDGEQRLFEVLRDFQKTGRAVTIVASPKRVESGLFNRTMELL